MPAVPWGGRPPVLGSVARRVVPARMLRGDAARLWDYGGDAAHPSLILLRGGEHVSDETAQTPSLSQRVLALTREYFSRILKQESRDSQLLLAW